jgi:hypothetical protein
MKKNARMFGRAAAAALWTTFALGAPGSFAQAPGTANDALTSSIANRMQFSVVDLSSLKPVAPLPAAAPVEAGPRATRSFTFDFTSDTVSYLVYSESGSGAIDIALPSGPERPFSYGPTVSFVYPGADLPVQAGTYRFDIVGAGSDAASVTSSVRRGGQPSSGVLDLNLFVLDGSGLTQSGLAAGLAEFADIYAGAGISLGRLSVVLVTGAEAYLSTGGLSEAFPLFGNLSRQMTANPPSRLAANFFFTKRVAGVYGYSQGIPAALGLTGTSAGGVVISIDTHMTDQGLDVHELGLTMAHENGHSMGLYHTSESDGSGHDTISDTPQCGGGDAAACPDGTNIMFWSGHFPDISPGQAYVLRRSPIVH